MMNRANTLAGLIAFAMPLSTFAAEPAATQPSAEQPRETSAQTAGPAVDTSAGPAVDTSAGPAVDTSSAAQTPAESRTPSATRQTQRAANDRLDLDTTIVTGNRELPKVLYIVPWKKADIGDLPAQPFNTLLDEVLTPVDRDVFRREVTYYGAVSSGGNAPAPASPPGTGGTEK